MEVLSIEFFGPDRTGKKEVMAVTTRVKRYRLRVNRADRLSMVEEALMLTEMAEEDPSIVLQNALLRGDI